VALEPGPAANPDEPPGAAPERKELVAQAQVRFVLGNDRVEGRERTEALLALGFSIVATVLGWSVTDWVSGQDGIVLREVLHAAACVLAWVALLKRMQTLHSSFGSFRSMVMDAACGVWAIYYVFWLLLKVVMR